jgi:hypothetical protein
VTAGLILAHAGHWFAGLLYLAPVLIVVGALGYQSFKDKRLGDEEEGAGPDVDQTPDPHVN